MPQIEKWNKQFGEEEFLAISISKYEGYKWDEEKNRGDIDHSLSAEDERASITAFADHHRIENTLAITQRQTFTALDSRAIPQLMVFDRTGTLRYIGVGAGEENIEALQKTIERLIRESSDIPE